MKISKILSLSLFALSALLASTHVSVAASPDYLGDYRIEPKVMHPTAITGKMTLVYGQQDALQSVVLDMDQPVMGMKQAPSSQQWAGPSLKSGATQLAVAFKLAGPRHNWLFVFVGKSTDGGQTVEGPLYKAPATLEEIQTLFAAADASAPATWKVIGNAVLKVKQ